MARLARFGISIDQDLLAKFDGMMKRKGYSNRSKAFADIVRQELVKQEWTEGKEVAGAIIMIYDHHKRELVNKLMDIQHDHSDIIISTQHVHFDHDNCLEVLAISGAASKVNELAGALRSIRGVKHTALGMSSTGKGI